MPIEEELLKIFPPARVKTRLIDRVAYASDAGFYRLVPQAIVLPDSAEEIASLFSLSQKQRVPLVFRAGGTSLSGQSVTDGILVDISRHWRKVRAEEEGRRVRVQPGVIGSHVNLAVRKYGRKMGPDPSSISSAMMGGILSNNSSGMCCGVAQNAYHTVKHLSFMLPDGNCFSTEHEPDKERFERQAAQLYSVIRSLKEEIELNTALSSRIRDKYRTKNTVGYGLNAFLDYQHPLDIFARLLIGAEGTLGFICEAVLETVPDHPCKSTALLYFPTIAEACKAIVPLIETGAEAVELMDRASLRSIEHIEGVPVVLKSLPETAAALLIEYQDSDMQKVAQKTNRFRQTAGSIQLINETVTFTEDPHEQAFLWKLRKGMFPSVGAVRQQGTTVILEDVAFPVHRLADAVTDLQILFKKYHYDNAIIFGHAKDGNLHFVVTQSFGTEEEITRYAAFIHEVVELVVKKYDGALKAEHGTGRNMAPFVETEWGAEAYSIMKKLKETADPHGLLNPGVIINNDPEAHLKNLKPLPVVEEEVDKCIECGYCEHVCPSRDLTLTPRRRIVVRRELAALKKSGAYKQYREILSDYQYDGLDTCAVDGLCATDCPVDINTGDLVKRLRKESHSAFSNQVALWLATHFSVTESLAKTGLYAGNQANKLTGKKTMIRITAGLRELFSGFPLWSNQLASPPMFLPQHPEKPDAVYFATCITRAMGGSVTGKPSLLTTFMNVAHKAGVHLLLHKDITGHCCGQPFSSKGYQEAYRFSVNKTIESLWKWTEQGTIPIVVDGSSCTYTLLHAAGALSPENKEKFQKLVFKDSVTYAVETLLPRLTIKQRKKHIAFHPLCSLTKMKIKDQLHLIGKACSETYLVPDHAGCCGMAGDRGFIFPELTQSATAQEVAEIHNQPGFDGYYSSGKPCEIALSEQSGKNYESILYLLDEVSG